MAPALGIITIFFLLPAAASLLLSLTDFDIYGLADTRNVRFVGLDNYYALWQDPLFWKALVNTCYFVFVGVPLSVVISLAAALLLESPLVVFRSLFRTMLFAPVVTTMVAVAVVWRYLYDTSYGLMNHALAYLGIAPIDWLGDPIWAMPAIILLAAWKNFGYNMIIFIAGLQSIPPEMHEAARVDGAGPWQRFTSITLPLLSPTFLFVGLTTMIGYFQLFAEPYVMTRGGPLHSTYSVVLMMYEKGFRFWNLGAASAIAFVLLLIMLAVSAAQVRLQRSALA